MSKFKVNPDPIKIGNDAHHDLWERTGSLSRTPRCEYCGSTKAKLEKWSEALEEGGTGYRCVNRPGCKRRVNGIPPIVDPPENEPPYVD